jgi:hypothetical protein
MAGPDRYKANTAWDSLLYYNSPVPVSQGTPRLTSVRRLVSPLPGMADMAWVVVLLTYLTETLCLSAIVPH